ncbi:major capsid protein [Capybara microvirus Cap1_SP_106]|nr:major capsid protein [Capybara microvirus Cap1_SP_106]
MDSIDSGSNYRFGNQKPVSSPPRSQFDLSHGVETTVNNCGSLIPITWFETVPGDSFDFSASSLLRVLPQVVPLYSRQRLYFYCFWDRMSSLWKNWNTYLKKGNDGKTLLTRPSCSSANMSTYSDIIKADDVADYLGLPQGHSISEIVDSCGHCSVLPFFMYYKIWRDYFMNRNLYINNKVLLPDDEDDFRLDINGELISNQYATSEEEKITFGKLLYRDYPDDRFTSALPFAQRGEQPSLPLKVSSSDDIPLSFAYPYGNAYANTVYSVYGVSSDHKIIGSSIQRNALSSTGGPSTSSFVNSGISSLDKSSIPFNLSSEDLNLALSSGGVNFTLDQFRNLAIATDELEKMARTDGSYASFGLAFFGRVSENADDYRTVFVGGCYQNVAFSEVLQTSQSTDNSPLGTFAGHGISFNQNGNLGHLECDDFGICMIVASVMPDIYYSQGVSSAWTRSVQSEEFLPDREKVGLVPILNRELFFTGDSEKDNDLFAYQNPFDEMRYIENKITGKIADSTNLSFFPYTQSRVFTSLPTYSQEFFRADNVRKDYLYAPIEDAYSLSVRFSIRGVRPLPYVHQSARVI